MKDVGRVVVIGAGPTGIGAAYRLKNLGHEDFRVLEAADRAGGLAASFVDGQGFTWDVGGHIQFSHYDYFDRAMDEALGEEWFHHERESWIWIADRFVPYPFQNNLRYLPQEMIVEALRGLAERPPRRNGTMDFGTWIDSTFGAGIRKMFMGPYNFKVWGYAPEKLWHGWVGERVAVVDQVRVAENIILQRDDVSWGPNNTFKFPKRGGTGSIWRALAQKLGSDHFTFNSKVTEVDWKRQIVRTQQGEEIRYDLLLSTMPVDTLCGALTPGLSEAGTASSNLLHSTSHIIGIGLKGEMPDHLQKKCWMYFPEDDCPFYRVTVFSHYSPNNVPEPETGRYWSLMAEISETEDKPVDRARIFEDTIQGMLNTRLIRSKDDVVSRWLYTAPYGYPTPSLDRNKLLARVQEALKPTGVSSRGRFGAWKYEVSNQDHSFMQGVEWVNWALLDVPETTVRFAETANGMWGRVE